MSERDIEWTHLIILNLVQALIGAITVRMSAIALKADPVEQHAVIYFALTERSSEDDELVEEIVDDLDILMEGQTLVTAEVWTGPDRTVGWPGREHRLVYAAYRPSRDLPAASADSPDGITLPDSS